MDEPYEPTVAAPPSRSYETASSRSLEGSAVKPTRASGTKSTQTITLRRAPLTASVGAAWDHPRVLICALATLIAMPLLLVGLAQGSGGRSTYRLETAAAGFRAPGSTSQAVTITTIATSTTIAANPLVAASKEVDSQDVEASNEIAAVSSDSESEETNSQTDSSDSTGHSGDSNGSSESSTDWEEPSTSEWTPPDTTQTPTTVWEPPSTTAPPATSPPSTSPPTTNPPQSSNSESGLATWYAHNPGGCASRTVPRGTRVTITASNGRSTSCVVDDYGPFGPGRIIDLSKASFSQLASLGTGVISVTVTW